MLISQAVTWMPIVHCDSCGAEIPTKDAIPYVDVDMASGLSVYNLHFFCNNTCRILEANLGVAEHQISNEN